jgi:hypothetical protein
MKCIHAVSILLGAVLPSTLGASCDRRCLEGHIEKYLSALSAHDSSSLPVTDGTVYVENSQFLPLDTGLWRTAGAPGKYRHTFSDHSNGQVGTITTLTENGQQIIYVVRLKIEENGTISEIESQVTRDAVGAQRYENMTVPEAVWLEPVPVTQRIPRARLIAQTDKYYSGMERNDPHGNYSFFDKDCNRLEDGLQTTNQKNGDPYGHSNDTAFTSLGCEAQFQTGFLGFVTKIRDRRYAVVDEERQAVLAMTIFDHNGTVRRLPSVNGTSSPIPPYFDVPRTLAASEAFRLREEKLYRIEMTLTEVPYGQRTAFDAGDDVELTGPGMNGTVADPCDRTCLGGVLNSVLDAMVRNGSSISSLPLSESVRYSENGQFIKIGDGLWGTLQHVSLPSTAPYAVTYADPENGVAGYWGSTKEQSTPGVLALRVQVDDGKITEIEAVSVRAESNDVRGGTATLMRPSLPVEWAGEDTGPLSQLFKSNATGRRAPIPESLVEQYFDAMEQHSVTASPGLFAPSCRRRDNLHNSNVSCAAQVQGHGASPNGLFNTTSSIRDRRILVSDAAKGVAMAVAMVDYTAIRPTCGGSLDIAQRVPSTYMVLQLMKVQNGTMAGVEGMVKWMPLGYTSGWGEEAGDEEFEEDGGYDDDDDDDDNDDDDEETAAC